VPLIQEADRTLLHLYLSALSDFHLVCVCLI